ncbi:hypothetical protein [Microbacterium pseudoresistens]|uniref:Uncharacterized protein n=1 Tax=Microbacterium pseudoresistens TaxID=640634 RepID=A0A7Y9EVD4_9MICO|nr:hypothetical protein [Microbacterium pseudoresistens]NYD54662.1 hypothetical protein [Microbacterium pseudoresistens]
MPHIRRGMRRALAAALGLGLIVGSASLAATPQTDAVFTDDEYAAASFSAGTVPTPTITSCTVSTVLNLGLVFTGVTIVWTSTYPPAQMRLTISGVTVPAQNIVVTGSGPYTYTATLNATLLQSLLGGLLGSENPVRIVATYPQNWESVAATRTLRVGGVLGLLGPNNCTAP